MSGICGIVNFDGAPVDPELLQKMAQAAAYRGPDGINYWTCGNVGLAHLALHTTPESVREKQPLTNQRNSATLVADARVDNRTELIRTLTAKGYLQDKQPTDADLILAAYECWGEECPKHIIGDFAFAVWDAAQQRLFCARDPVGIRSLFYCRQGQTLFFATAISSLLAGLGERPPLNEPLLIDFLCWRFERWVNETAYQTISRLPASYSLAAGPTEDRLTRYWTFGLPAQPRYKTDQEYIERFRELFEEAIRCRLRSASPVGISVSGGLDSSSIACMTHHMMHGDSRSLPPQAVQLYSCVFNEKFPKADERVYLNAVLEKCHQFPFTAISGETLWGFKETCTNGSFCLDEPETFPIRCMLTAVLQDARQRGCRVLLTGEGGDQILNDAAYWMPQLLLDVHPWQALAELKHFWKRNGWSTPKTLLWRIIAPLAGRLPFAPQLRQWRLARSAPAWIDKDRLQLLDQSQAATALYPLPPSLSRAAEVTYRQLTGGWYAALLNYLNAVSGLAGVEYRLPYLDRRLIGFMLGVPPHLRFAGGLTKMMLRQATSGILAEKVRQRAPFAHFSETLDYGLREKEKAQVGSLLAGISANQFLGVNKENLEADWQMYYRQTALPPAHFIAPLLLQDWLHGCNAHK